MSDQLARAAARAFQDEDAERLDAPDPPAPTEPEGFQAEGGEHSRTSPQDTAAGLA